MKKKRNDKGFSLVELIVVIAIMAILAVTLAPRLMQYVEKSRKAADKEVINSIYTAVQYGLLDTDINDAAFKEDGADSGTDVDLAALKSGAGLYLNYDSTDDDAITDIYEISGKTWTQNSKKSDTDTTYYTYYANKFIQEIYNVVGNFKLKSNDADESTDIIIYALDNEKITVDLYYDGYSSGATADYSASYTSVK